MNKDESTPEEISEQDQEVIEEDQAEIAEPEPEEEETQESEGQKDREAFTATIYLDMDVILSKPLGEIIEVLDDEIWAVRRSAIQGILKLRGEKTNTEIFPFRGRLAKEEKL
jgi:hypothetical protein